PPTGGRASGVPRCIRAPQRAARLFAVLRLCRLGAGAARSVDRLAGEAAQAVAASRAKQRPVLDFPVGSGATSGEPRARTCDSASQRRLAASLWLSARANRHLRRPHLFCRDVLPGGQLAVLGPVAGTRAFGTGSPASPQPEGDLRVSTAIGLVGAFDDRSACR